MRVPSQRWLRVTVLATALVFVGVAVYLYGLRFREWIESDAAVTVVLASKAIHAKSPVVDNWYYANGDVWLVAAHLIAIVPVALIGVGVTSLLITVLIGFLLELYAFTKVYARLAGELWIGIFSAMVTMMAWSTAHVAFGYIQLAYAFLTCLCMVSFVIYATLAESALVKRARWIVACLLIALIAAQNPTRTLAFIYAPVVGACLWPWRGFPLRRRLMIVGVATIGWLLAFVVYAFVFARLVTFSSPRGHLDFKMIHDLSGLGHNLSYLARGFTVLCGGGSAPSVLSLPGLFLMLGALVLVVREALSSRALDALRFVVIAVLAQFAVVLVPVVLGNLLVDVPSVRYILPSLIEMLGLAAILAVRTLDDVRVWWRRFAMAWLVAVPLTAVLAIRDVSPPPPTVGIWPNSVELDRVAKELVRRNLTRGYSNVLAANLVTMQSGGAAMTCPIYFSQYLTPLRWLTDTSCFDAKKLPERFFVVADQRDEDRKSLAATLPAPIEKFSVGSSYEVYVYRTADTSPAWLELPLPSNDKNAFPLHIAAKHLQMQHAKVVFDGNRAIATGETGPILYGPYITLPRGRYTVSWIGSGIASPGEIKMYVAAEGKDKLGEASVLAANIPTTPGVLGKVVFKLAQSRDAIELVIYSQDGGKVALDEMVIERH